MKIVTRRAPCPVLLILVVVLGSVGEIAAQSASNLPVGPMMPTVPATPILPARPEERMQAATVQSPQGTPTTPRQSGDFTLDVSRGVRIGLDNRTVGPITVTGWDRDVIEAHAVSSRGKEVVFTRQIEDTQGKRVFLKADYADLDNPDAPAMLEYPPLVDDRPVEIQLEVKVPRYAELDVIRVTRSNVQISGVETPINIAGDRSTITLNNVGSAEVHTRSGKVEIDGVNGLVEVATTSGPIRVSNSEGAVRAVSIAGPIEINCARGRIDVTSAEAPIELINIDGDADAIATNSNVRFRGNIREDGRYYLKSMSGGVEMQLPGNTQGFSATLSSYRGDVATDFPLKTRQANPENPANRRLAGRIGNGKAQITLDSFEGLVRLTKIADGAIARCKR
jgi:hypothetical protein